MTGVALLPFFNPLHTWWQVGPRDIAVGFLNCDSGEWNRGKPMALRTYTTKDQHYQHSEQYITLRSTSVLARPVCARVCVYI